MFRPESDWSEQGLYGAEAFAIDRRVHASDATVDIRRFRWVTPSSGLLSPARHYLDYSLIPQTRQSLLKAEPWSDVRHSGDMLYLPPGYEYWGQPALQERHMLCVALGDNYLADLFEDDAPLAKLMPCADVQSAPLRRLLEGMAAELTTPGFGSDALVESMLTGVAVELVRHLQRTQDVLADVPHPNARQVRAITDYVMAHLSSPVSIAQIARACGMSTRHVARVFKEATGISLGEFVARSRIALAKELLERDHLPIKEISWQCGFSSTSAFSAAFRSATGRTPREFRTGAISLQ